MRVRDTRSARTGARGVALLMVLSAIVILALVLVEFGVSARTHLTQGVNLRDDARATTMADTALVLARACLDPRAWGPMASFQDKVDTQKLCNLLLDIFVSGRVDLPVGGLSVELEGIEGVGIATGEIEDIELTPEESYIGMRGLWCPPVEGRPLDEQKLDCQTRKAAVLKLRALLCDPTIAYVFEKEQDDGHKYTREEVIGNLVDWVDSDDDRILVTFSPLLDFQPDLGEGEDSYLRAKDRRYRSKDAPFDSVHELRLVRGVNDDLFEFLRDKISVHAAEQINVNEASAEVLGALLFAHSPQAQAVEGLADGTCGEVVDGALDVRAVFVKYARIIKDYAAAKQANLQYMLSPAFLGPADFVKVAKDPLSSRNTMLGYGAGTAGAQLSPDEQLLGYQLHVQREYDDEGKLKDEQVIGLPSVVYAAIQSSIDWNGLQKDVKTRSNLYRLRVRGRVGNMTRSLFAILKKDKLDANSDAARDKKKKDPLSGKSGGGVADVAAGLPLPKNITDALGGNNQVIIRTLYYREE